MLKDDARPLPFTFWLSSPYSRRTKVTLDLLQSEKECAIVLHIATVVRKMLQGVIWLNRPIWRCVRKTAP